MRTLPWLVAILATAGTLPGCGAEPDGVLYEDGDRRYAISVASAPDALVVRVTPKGRWELAPAYPVELRWATHVKGAAEAERLDAHGLAFRIPAVRDPASKIEASARFGVCVGVRCEPVEHAFRVAGHAADERSP